MLIRQSLQYNLAFSFSLIVSFGQYHVYIWCVYDISGRGIAKCTVIYGVYKRFWPTLSIVQLPE
jgi:hypothetical protein